MKLVYIANARMPTEKAHGFTIAKSCEAFAKAGAEVVLLLPRRKTQFIEDIFDTYHVSRVFEVRYLPSIDMLKWFKGPGAFYIGYFSFYICAFFTLLKLRSRDCLLYTRDAPFLTLSLLGMRAIFECHAIRAQRGMFFRFARYASSIVVISQALKNAFVSAGFLDRHMLVAPSGVDLSTFAITTPCDEARKGLKLPLSASIVSYTGNFTTMGADKGISDILRALKYLPDVLFVAVGGSEKDCERYTKEAHELNLRAQVRLDGFCSQQTLALYSRAADILLMPFPDTPHYRNHMSPVKMFEYMASGRPIIATDLPTIREVLHEKNAILVPPNNPLLLAKAVKELLADRKQGEALALQAKSDVRVYGWDERARRVLSFIHLS